MCVCKPIYSSNDSHCSRTTQPPHAVHCHGGWDGSEEQSPLDESGAGDSQGNLAACQVASSGHCSVAQGTLAGGCPQVPIRRKTVPGRKRWVNMTSLTLIKFDRRLFCTQGSQSQFSECSSQTKGKSCKTRREHRPQCGLGLAQLYLQAVSQRTSTPHLRRGHTPTQAHHLPFKFQ